MTVIMLLLCFLLCSVLSVGNPLSETFHIRSLGPIMIRNEEDDALENMTDYSNSRLSPEYSQFLASADESKVSSDLISMSSAGTDTSSLGLGTDDIDQSPRLFENSIIRTDLNPGGPLAFHDGDLPEDGWGDCDFPKMPACCEHTILGVTCMWYNFFGGICPDHPADIWPPRTEAEQAQYRAVCCDRIVDQMGIRCVPVHDRFEPSMEEEENMADDLDDFFPLLRDYNAIKFIPIPDACKAPQRRDSQTQPPCSPQKQ